MKPTSKKDYPFVVECENKNQTNAVLNYYDNNNDVWAHWKYVLVNSDEDKDVFDTKKFLNFEDEFTFISYSEWVQLPDYVPEEVAFKECKKIIGYKLMKTEYEKAALKIAFQHEAKAFQNFKSGVDFYKGSMCYVRLQEAGVLDLWFKPVYEEPTKEEKILNFLAGHGLNVNPEYVKYIINIVNENNESK